MKKWLITFSVSLLAAGSAFAAGTPYHEDKANIVEPADDRNPLAEVISGYDFRKSMIREMQDDEFSNPGMVVVDYGAEIWEKVEGSAGKSMAEVWESCAGVDAATAATTYPRFHEGAGKVISLEQQINYCRENAMGAKPYKWEKQDMLGMTAFIRYQGNGDAVNVSIDGPANAAFKKGEKLFYERVGQLDMSCAHCHEDNYGNYIRADMLSQGQINGFPTYRVKWNGVGSTHRRFRGCNGNIRATKLPYGHEDYVALELYIAWRGNGLNVETPAVRQ